MDEGISFGVVVVGIIVILMLIGGVLGNIVNLSVFKDYGYDIYKNNICYVHKECYISLDVPLKFYDKMYSYQDILNNNKEICSLVKGQNLKLIGSVVIGNITWFGVKIYIEEKEVKGFIFVPEKVTYYLQYDNNSKYFHKTSPKDLQSKKYKENWPIFKARVEELVESGKIKIKYFNTFDEKQILAESVELQSQWNILSTDIYKGKSNQEELQYISETDHKLIEKLRYELCHLEYLESDFLKKK